MHVSFSFWLLVIVSFSGHWSLSSSKGINLIGNEGFTGPESLCYKGGIPGNGQKKRVKGKIFSP
jgi:hypothetical protein